MRVLWIVNTIFPYPSKELGIENTSFGGWLISLFNEVKETKNFKFCIVTTYTGEKLLKFEDEGTIYYLLPCKDATKYDEKLIEHWDNVVKEFQPDLIHIHGSEYAHSLPLLRNMEVNIPTLLSIQGLIHKIAEVYLADIPRYEIYRNITFRDILKRDSIIQQQKKFFERGEIEKEILSRVDAVIGRTNWDYENSLKIKEKLIYYKNNESLRDEFYRNIWDIDNIERNTIFYSQASYTIKGLHFMIEALNILKKEIPNIKLRIAGHNILDSKSIKSKLKRTGYAKYISKLIRKYELQDNITFTGILNEQQMCEEYLKANIFVQGSIIENSPNSLGEAMLLGVPCVASNVGGTSSMLEHEKEGLLYKYNDISTLVNYIKTILKDDNKAILLGKNARERAKETHNKDKNVKDLLEIYANVKEIK